MTFLTAAGRTHVQGYLFSKPLSTEVACALLLQEDALLTDVNYSCGTPRPY
jgi:EAL domain-containing protein (putative c-di-GMP-specific phosphodiesterase class I)